MEIVPLILYPTQLHYVAHTIGGLEIGQQTLRFTGIRNILVSLQSAPVSIILWLLLLDIDINGEPGRGEVGIYNQIGEAMLLFTLALCVANLTMVLVGDMKPKKTRSSRLKPVDTFLVSVKERSTVFVYTVSELLSSTAFLALVIHVKGAIGYGIVGGFYALLVLSWRWWAKRMKNREMVVMFALLFSIPNLLGTMFTAGKKGTVIPTDMDWVALLHSFCFLWTHLRDCVCRRWGDQLRVLMSPSAYVY